MNIWISALILVCAVFIVLGINSVVSGILRTRRRSAAVSESDAHMFAVPGLGTTMADGGESQEAPPDRK